ncbi:CD3324 family protein [Wukongibacter baidiensis]|uniref:CD3324 family protein n=1 Tax=Wukongibacter baidiensis TaxID=1723361 RepID=UPI003D7F4A61
MRYVKAETILPDNLVKEIQKYVQGQYIYVSSQQSTRKKWGEKSGSREFIRNRNQDIRKKHKSGYTIAELAEEFFLSIHSIKKIVYTKSK